MVLELHTGLVIVTRENNIFSNSISMVLGHYWTHCYWIREVNEDNVLIQEASGTKSKKVTSYWIPRYKIENYYEQNRLMCLYFGLDRFEEEFYNFCDDIENSPYDYFAGLELGIARFMTLFGFNSERFLKSKSFNFIRKKFNSNYTTEKKVDCSELIARGLYEVAGLDIRETLKLNRFEDVAPQHLAIFHYKLREE